MTYRASSLAAAVVAIAVAGCGGSGGNGLSRADLARRADSICNTYNPQVTAVRQPKDLATNAASAARFFDAVAPIYDTELIKIKALKPADSAKTAWNDLVSKFEPLVKLVDQIRAKADAKDPSGIALLAQVGPLSGSANAAAKSFGAADCAK